jgi:hypothetical protein
MRDGAVEHGLLPVEVNELLERKRRSDEVARHVLDGLLVLEGDRLGDVRGDARISPDDELSRKVLRDRMSLDEAGEQALAEQLHHCFRVPALERVKNTVLGDGPIRGQATGPGPRRWRWRRQFRASVRTELLAHVLGDGLGGAPRKVEQELAPLAEDPAQEAWHGEDDAPMRNGLEDLLLEPFRPQELSFFSHDQHARPTRRASRPCEAMGNDSAREEPA